MEIREKINCNKTGERGGYICMIVIQTTGY